MRVRVAVLAFLSLSLAGCFEDPVYETLLIQMMEEGLAQVTATVSIQEEPKERLGDLKRAYLNGQDPWSVRFDRTRVEYEERTIHRALRGGDIHGGGKLLDVSKIRHMVVIPREELALLLGDSGVTITTFASPAGTELLIVPGGGSLASSEQRRVLRTSLEAWSTSAQAYVREVSALYEYLDSSPDRATAIFAELFDDLVEDEVTTANPLLEDEVDLVARTSEAMKSMADQLADGADEIPFGLNELSYLVYDPLPAAVTVCIPRAPEDIEGFVPRGDLCYTIPRRGIIDAFEALDGRWLEPDPFVTWIRIHRSGGEEKLDLAGFAAKKRSVSGHPTASEILKALEEGMRHERSYRLRWIETVGGR